MMRSLIHRTRRALRAIEDRVFPSRARRRKRRWWEQQWASTDFAPRWLNRGVSKQIVAAVEDGWFARGGAALDIGCGEGEVAAWLADQGFHSVGVDIAPSAVQRAKTRFPPRPGELEFHAVDVCAEPPPDHQYTVLIDRGCFHQIADRELPHYTKNIIAVSAADARMMLFTMAFRDASVPDERERAAKVQRVQRAYAGQFRIERFEDTYLDPFDGQREDKRLRGMVFWLIRCGA